MTAPMTPEACDLGGYEWMPIFGAKLFTSGWYVAALQDGRGGIAALKLWWVAMQQVPAGSLPNDEHELAFLADFGTDIRAWKKHRTLAMRGFVLCDDGRWYHPFLCEQAMKAWEKKRNCAAQRETWRRQKQAQRNGAYTEDVHVDIHADNQVDNGNVHPDVPRARSDKTREEKKEPPRSPPVTGGGAPRGNGRVGRGREKPLYRNGFRQLEHEERERQRANLVVIDGEAEAVDSHAFLGRLRAVAHG